MLDATTSATEPNDAPSRHPSTHDTAMSSSEPTVITLREGEESASTGADPYSLLLVTADFVDDIERVRIATENRLRSLEQVKGMTGTPEHARWVAQLDRVCEIERNAVRELERAMRAHPLGGYVKATVGIGAKQAARLLAATGDPGERPNVAKLWAYCGFHVVDGRRPRRQKGVRSNWSNTAKMRARLCAESCIKHAHSPYREVYDRERDKWSDRDTTDGHKHNHALAVVAKEILKDLWICARTGDDPRAIPKFGC